MHFSRPKEWNPDLATESERKAQLLSELGLEDESVVPFGPQKTSAPLPGSYDVVVAEKDRLESVVTELTKQNQELKSNLKETQQNERQLQQKIANMQQLNRSQTTLVRNELQKYRSKLRRMRKVAHCLKQQVDYLVEMYPKAVIPHALAEIKDDGEDEPEDEDEEITPWPSRGLGPPGGADAEATSAASSGDTSVLQRQVAELTAKLKEVKGKAETYKAYIKKQAAELDRLKKEGGGGEDGTGASSVDSPLPVSSSGAAAASTTADAAGAASVMSEKSGAASGIGGAAAGVAAASSADGKSKSSLEEELQAAKKSESDTMKKLQKLAAAYQALQKKQKAAEEAEGSKGEKLTAAMEVLKTVRVFLATQKEQVAETRNFAQKEISRLSSETASMVESSVPALVAAKDAEVAAIQEKFVKEATLRRQLHNLVQELRGNIRVYCRVRPLMKGEPKSCISFPGEDEIRISNELSGQRKTFRFDKIFQMDSTQQMVFEEVQALVTSVMDGYNVCIFAYGQTGSGKTHSMQGYGEDKGIYTRTFNELFQVMKERGSDWKYVMKVSMIEIYNDDIKDLLGDEAARSKKLAVRQGPQGNYVPDLTLRDVVNAEGVEECLTMGTKNRSVGQTNMNEHSSRSHLVLSVVVDTKAPNGKSYLSRMHLVDLAGSERINKSGATGDRAKEAMHINKSLTALGDVISSRAAKSSHIPYRNSTLTYLLQDALGGDSKTLMLLQINPTEDAFEESQCSLTFAARANQVEMAVEKKK
uniref:Kinesin-like protein n=1 Tax=Chromera velia CCMP2878 TaxID=1169474 RepID=A0A0G4IDS4_9ALVE|eukprot:Cvel_13536.t1-p1 / transcript=Cvel_13536.t1 / gene=Cvel_13536 / organism=Chromera_velia_CCMP2878 / gene_product=Kinesin-like protein KIFC3, putative / transcript_product=Kinesin-like protein KIFC3, putative / location=Cvel_scaffold929:5278-13761(-) / protein_length=759 / sequence_SO=supercontig / SO=protein_coding / is_pseudo=false